VLNPDERADYNEIAKYHDINKNFDYALVIDEVDKL